MDKETGNIYNNKKGVEVIHMSTVLRNDNVTYKPSVQTLQKTKKVSAKEMRKKIATPSVFGVTDISLFKQGK